MEYNRIIYPERAEYLNEGKFKDYKVYLEHWDAISSKLKSNFEEALLRSVSKGLIIYGMQSAGKTLLANKITDDYRRTSGVKDVSYDSANIWHRIVSGFGKSVDLISTNTQRTSLLHIEDDVNWVDKVKVHCTANSDRTSVIIFDNCERDYFIQALASITDEQLLQIGRTDALIQRAAQRYVALCRSELRNTLVIMLTNDELFALTFEDSINTNPVFDLSHYAAYLTLLS